MPDKHEKISALIDGDLRADEIDSLLDATGAAETTGVASGQLDAAARYTLIGDVLRHQVDDTSLTDIRAGVAAAIAEESGGQQAAPAAIATAPRKPRFDLSAWLRPQFGPLGGMAIAASVAMITVFTVGQLEQPGTTQAPLATIQSPVQDDANLRLVAETRPVNQIQQVRERINEAAMGAYLEEHAEVAAQDTVQGRMPFVRAVSYEAE